MNEQLVIGLFFIGLAFYAAPALVLEGYLWRWHLVPRNKLFNVYLHVFIGGDEKIHHDHPWSSLSVKLWGKLHDHVLFHYWVGPTATSYVRRQSFITCRPKTHKHFVTLHSKFAITLFFTGPLQDDGEWFFYPANGDKVPFWSHPQAFNSWRWRWSELRYIKQEVLPS